MNSRRDLTALQRQGHRGSAILPHRAIASHALPVRRLIEGLLLSCAFTLALAALQPWVASGWGEIQVWWMQALELPGHFVVPEAAPRQLLTLPVPLIDPQLRTVELPEVGMHALAVITLWFAAGWLPDRAKPLAFLLRFALLLHGSAVLYLLFWPASFPHTISDHVGAGLRQSWLLILATPWLHLCTYHLFPFPAWQRVALTSVSTLFLLILAPLQYASHAALVCLAGPIVMPLLYLLFGLMVPVMGLVALYGWAMSWSSPAADGAEG